MPNGLSGIIATLETLAVYTGPWRVLRGETSLLQARLAELREREQRLDDVLLVALVGGSGVGKSTLLNALAGDQIAETSEMRPCTSAPTVYHPPGMQFNMAHLTGVRHVARSALENIALIDTPDSDTIVKEHRRIVEQVLHECDLILLCADGEKYLDEATWSLLYPLRGLRAIVCVETRVTRPDTAIREHWLKKLGENDFEIDQYFRVNALRALDRKLAGIEAQAAEFDFTRLERFLRHELDRERVARIKSSNAAGLLTRTVTRLHEQFDGQTNSLEALATCIDKGDQVLAEASLRYLTAGTLAEPHLWVQALGREVGLRAGGGIGALYKIVEMVRSLPYRLPVWLSFSPHHRGQEVTENVLFSVGSGTDKSEGTLPEALKACHDSVRSETRLQFIRAGFDMPESMGNDDYRQELSHRIRTVFGGAIHERLAARARLVTLWPVMLLLNGLPIAFVGYAGYLVLNAFFQGDLLPTTSFLHLGMLFVMLIAAELILLSGAVRLLAWGARRKGLQSLQKTLSAPGLAFTHEKRLLTQTGELMQTIRQLKEAVTGSQRE